MGILDVKSNDVHWLSGTFNLLCAKMRPEKVLWVVQGGQVHPILRSPVSEALTFTQRLSSVDVFGLCF